MRYATDFDEVAAIVNEAINRGIKVKAFGARHSQSDIICTEGIPVVMTKLKFFRMEEDNVTATFGSGVTLQVLLLSKFCWVKNVFFSLLGLLLHWRI